MATSNLSIKVGGTWKDTTEEYVKVSGTWKPVDSTYMKVNGVWKEINTIPAPVDRFTLRVKSPQTPVVQSVTGGQVSIADNGDGSWDITSSDTITDISLSDNAALTEANFISAPDLKTLQSGFKNCINLSKITSVPLPKFERMSYCFLSCHKLLTIDMTPFATVVGLYQTFKGSGLTSFDSSPLTAIEVLDDTFRDCVDLVTVDTSGFGTALNAINTFRNTVALKHLDTTGMTSVKSWSTTFYNAKIETVNATGMSGGNNFTQTFRDCSQLTCITSLTVSGAVDVTDMFSGATNLVHPDAAEQTAHFKSTGIDWVNPNPCP